MRRAVTIAAGLLLAALLVLQAVAIVQRADREPHIDEIEYLHAAWLMAHGEQLYTAFFEHHPPFLFSTLQLLASDNVRGFFVRARLLSGTFAVIALLAYAAVVWRAHAAAAPIALALLFGSMPMWMIGLAAARAEPFALAFFWCGVALVLLPRGDDRRASVMRGAGLAFVAIAALWNPKWPFSSAVVAAFWLAGTRRRMLSAAVAAALTGVAALILHRLAPLDRIWFFVVDFNRAFWPWLARAKDVLETELRGGVPFLYAPVLLRPLVVAAVFLLGAAALRRQRLPLFFLLLACASMIELRFIFPWPAIWHHYYLMWGFAGAALVGLVPAAVEALLAKGKMRHAQAIALGTVCVILLVAAAHLVAVAPVGPALDSGPYWLSQRYLHSRLQPGDTVLLEIRRHPVAVRDASYYWFGFFPVADELRRTPRGARYLPVRTEMPFCALTRGVRSPLRYVSKPRLLTAPPHEEHCFQKLLATGRIRTTPFANVFEIVR